MNSPTNKFADFWNHRLARQDSKNGGNTYQVPMHYVFVMEVGHCKSDVQSKAKPPLPC